MKNFYILLCALLITISAFAQSVYTPSEAIRQSQQEFQDMKFGMFIHWGVFSVLGDGEWVMNNKKIRAKEYHTLINVFNPVNYDPAKWVSLAKAAGMKYIVFVTRHHDGFSNWDTKQSDWKITHTPYAKDALKMLADECHKQGIKLGLYYSLLDWTRDDYPRETGRTGKYSGRTGPSDYNSYFNFMKAQLTELLTNYGDITSIWFDGHWDQTNPEGQKDRSSRLDWRYDELYGLIHQLQPACLIGNNHHLDPLPGENFQMFERDLPGENKSGLSFQQASQLPLETCETLNKSWGFDIKDTSFKSFKTVIHYLVNAAGRNANLLLNIGPMADGQVQQECIDTLTAVGEWMKKNGKTIYGTRGFGKPQDWGVITKKENKLYLHILNKPASGKIMIPAIGKIKNASVYGSDVKLKATQRGKDAEIDLAGITADNIDTILEIQLN